MNLCINYTADDHNRDSFSLDHRSQPVFIRRRGIRFVSRVKQAVLHACMLLRTEFQLFPTFSGFAGADTVVGK